MVLDGRGRIAARGYRQRGEREGERGQQGWGDSRGGISVTGGRGDERARMQGAHRSAVTPQRTHGSVQ